MQYIPQPDIVRVTWKGSGYLGGWHTPVQLANWADPEEDFTMITTGYLVGEHEDWIAIAQTYVRPSGMSFSVTRIPQTAIVDMEVIDGT